MFAIATHVDTDHASTVAHAFITGIHAFDVAAKVDLVGTSVKVMYKLLLISLAKSQNAIRRLLLEALIINISLLSFVSFTICNLNDLLLFAFY